MNLRAAQTVAAIKIRRAMVGRSRKRRKLPAQIPPRPIEREYAAAIGRLVDRAVTELEPLYRELPQLLARAQADREHVDAVDGKERGAPPWECSRVAGAIGNGSTPRPPSTMRRDAGEGKRIRDLVDAARGNLRASLSTDKLEALAGEFAQRTTTYQRIQLSRQLHAAVGVDVLVTDRKLAAVTEGFVAENVALIKTVPDVLFDKIEQATTRAVTEGTLHTDLAKELAEQVGVAKNRAALIARDQVGKIYGQANAARQAELGIDRFVWRTVNDARVRDEHKDLEGKIFSYADGGHPEEGLPGEPINCVPADAPVSLHAPARKAYRRRYRGELTVLVTDAGEAIRCTPQHPVLTSRGWLAAHLVEVGDHLVKAPAQRVDLAIEHVERGDATAAEVFHALEAARGLRPLRLAARGFHGDAAVDEQVDIVEVERRLLIDGDAERAQVRGEHELAFAPEAAAARRHAPADVVALACAADGVVRGAGPRSALSGGGASHAQDHRVATTARLDAGGEQRLANGGAGAPDPVGDRFLARPGAVPLHDLSDGQLERLIRRRVHAAPDEQLAHARVLCVEAARDGVQPRPGEVCRDDIILRKVIRSGTEAFDGLVFNFETSTGWYASHGLIVHNCRCYAEPVLDDILNEIDPEGASAAGAPS